MANDVFEPQTGSEFNVPIGGAEAPNVSLDLPREVESKS